MSMKLLRHWRVYLDNNIIDLIRNIAPLNRYNVSEGLNEALVKIKNVFNDLEIVKFKTGDKIWDWEIPQQWFFKSAKLFQDDKLLYDAKDEILRVWSGSWSLNKEMNYEELKNHLYYDELVSEAIAWKYKYYQNDSSFAGMSVSFDEFKKLDKSSQYRMEIDAHFSDGEMHAGVITIPGEVEASIVISCDICHPGQVNDSLSGLYNALSIYLELKKKKNYFTYIFTFQAEMIGTMALMSSGAINIENICYAIYAEMLGHEGKFVLQKSFSGNSFLDAVALKELYESNMEFEAKNYLDRCIVNDELIYNHVGISIPAISFNRSSFRYYHTSFDNFNNINFEKVEEATKIIKKIIFSLDSSKHLPNRDEKIQKPASFANRYEKNEIKEDFIIQSDQKGPIFLSKYNLYVDWQDEPELNRGIEKILLMLNGEYTVYDISQYSGIEFNKVLSFLKKLENNNLIKLSSVLT